jgi:uncharacterized protein (DUF849 family)
VDKLIITVAPTGAWPTKEITPYVPIEPEEIAAEVYQCWQAGAAMAHIHVRDDQQKASMDLAKFKKTVELIRSRKDCDIILNLTTSGNVGLQDEERMKPFMELKPEMASYDAGTMNWMHTTVFENRPDFLEKLALRMKEYGVKPELEIFDTGMIYNTLYYLKKGALEGPQHYQFVLGAAGGAAGTVENLLHMLSLIPAGSTWSAFGIGASHMPIMFAAIAKGGHIRVGMEDNVYMSKGVLAKSNVEFVARVQRIAKEFGREVATPDEARKILGLK